MYFWAINIILVFVLCVLFAGVLIPQILLISFRKKLYDSPCERKIHQGAIPRLGGIAFKPVIVFSMVLLVGVNEILGFRGIFIAAREESLALLFGYCALIVLYLVGMADDLIGVRYRAKFVVLILCGVMFISGGVWINNLCGVVGIHAIPEWFGYPLSILFIIFVINAINLIDGIDGLASGLSSVALFFYGWIFIMVDKYIYAMLAFATLGVLVPFFYYNVFGKAEHGKKIFMGDTGSLTIGAILCFLSIKLLLYLPEGDMGSPNPLVVAFSPLIIPCFDTVRVFFRRISLGKNPFNPDMNHIHHRLLAVGMSQRRAMIVLLSVSLLFTLCNVFLSEYVNVNLLLIADTLAWVVLNLWLSFMIRKQTNNNRIPSNAQKITG